MKALQLTAAQQPPEVREVETPEPGPRQVLVKVAGAGACHSDIHIMDAPEGLLGWPLPMTLGHENAGWVEALGAGATGLEVGQPVAVYATWGCGLCHPCRIGFECYCDRSGGNAGGGGLGEAGGMAEYLLVPDVRYLVPLASLDPRDAAPLTDAGLTPYHAVKRSLPVLEPGTTAVVIGVGGLGHLGVQLLRTLSPAAIVAVDTAQDKLDLAAEVGADHVVLAGDGAADQIKGLSGGLGAHLVVDFVGADPTLALAKAVARTLGHLTVVGIGGGSMSFDWFGVPRDCSVASTYYGSIPELMELVALAEAGRVRAHTQRFTLDEAPTVYERLKAGQVQGRAVVLPNG